MSLFNKLNKPIFLKEDSDATTYIAHLIELQSKTTGKLKDMIDTEIKIATMGEFGENNITFELKNSGMPMYVMHDMHFEVDGLSAQIDFIVVTRKVTFIIECKNLIGNIEIDNQGNFIRTYELYGKFRKEGCYSPITQNQRHMEVLKQIRRNTKGNVLTKMLFDKYFEDNYKSIVVLANPKTVLYAKYAKKEIKQMVIRADQLNEFIKETNQKSTKPAFSDKEMKEFAESLLSMHTPNQSDYAKKYVEIVENMTVAVDNVKEEDSNVDTVIDEDKSVSNGTGPYNINEVLIKELKAFRLQKSREESIKPYFIFNDKQMMDLIERMPDTKEALQMVYGFGQVKAEKYGDFLLRILKEHRPRK